jgi:hypothetical protein
VTLGWVGTLSVLGSHLRRPNESDTGRYQNLRGQSRLVCPAGTVAFLHHGIWHGGWRNDSGAPRHMFKFRFNQRVRQRRLWDTSDLAAPRVAAELDTAFPWYEHATGRLERYNRVLLWRALTGDEAALCDGWRLIQAAQLIPPHPGHEYDVSFLRHDFLFEKLVDLRNA